MSPETAPPTKPDPVTVTAATADDAYFLRDAIFDLVGEVYADDIVAIVRDWLATYERAGCGLGDAQAELEEERRDAY